MRPLCQILEASAFCEAKPSRAHSADPSCLNQRSRLTSVEGDPRSLKLVPPIRLPENRGGKLDYSSFLRLFEFHVVDLSLV